MDHVQLQLCLPEPLVTTAFAWHVFSLLWLLILMFCFNKSDSPNSNYGLKSSSKFPYSHYTGFEILESIFWLSKMFRMDFCKHHNYDFSGFINSQTFLKRLRLYWILKKKSAPWSETGCATFPAVCSLFLSEEVRVRCVGPLHVDLRRTERRRNRFCPPPPKNLEFFPTRMIPPLLRSVLNLSTTDALQSETLTGSLREKLSSFSLSEKIFDRNSMLRHE